jgi:hypothetical protein
MRKNQEHRKLARRKGALERRLAKQARTHGNKTWPESAVVEVATLKRKIGRV